MRRVPLLLALMAGIFGVVGCQKGQGPNGGKKGEMPPPKVEVATPIYRKLTDYERFTGKTESALWVALRARVSGTLEKANYKEGSIVQKGQVLFVIDQRQYKVDLARATARLASAQASLALAQSQEARVLPLVRDRALAREDYDKATAEVKVARASVQSAEADIAQAKLNLEWTEVHAPFTGRIGKWEIDPGNMVKADDTILAYTGTIEPMLVTFDADERTVLRQLIDRGLKADSELPVIQVEVGLVDEPDRYPHRATINFVDASLDSSTGSLWMRAAFDKPKRLILSGMFSRIRFPLGPEREQLCVAEQAFMQDQGRRSLYVVGPDGKAVKRSEKLAKAGEPGDGSPPLVIGRQHGQLRVVLSGLDPTDRVIVSGLQRVRPNTPVQPVPVEMPGKDSIDPADEPGGG